MVVLEIILASRKLRHLGWDFRRLALKKLYILLQKFKKLFRKNYSKTETGLFPNSGNEIEYVDENNQK